MYVHIHVHIHTLPPLWRHSGLIVSALNFGSSGPGPSPGWGHCVVFLVKITLLSQCQSLHPGELNGNRQI